MPGKWTKRLVIIIGLIIFGSACNISQVVVRETVVVTATSATEGVPTDVPTLVPTNTEIPPTVPPPPPPPPTKPPAPPPTLPQLVVEAIPGQLKARVVHPDYFPAARTSLTFEVQAYDPKVGNKDGDGIKDVEFRIRDNNDNEVLKQVEQKVPYCSFGGDNPCPVWVFAVHGNKWPNGQPIKSGTYTLQVNIHAQNSDRDMDFDTQFDIQLGQ
jgi:hypothetical protein